MKIKPMLSFSLLSAFIGAPTQAIQLNMEPGLWEHKFTITSDDSDMQKQMDEVQKQLANLPPAQRKMMEDMMAAQGIGMGADGTSVKLCMTREQIARGELPQQDKHCRQDVTQEDKNNYKIEFSCTGNPAMSGTGNMHFSDSKHYTGKTVLIKEDKGKTQVMTFTQDGTWLSAECGNIKPIH